MRGIHLPLPDLEENETAEFTVLLKEKQKSYNFKLEVFPWVSVNSEQVERINMLRNAINTYNPDFELIQIYTPAENAESIQVLFRKRY